MSGDIPTISLSLAPVFSKMEYAGYMCEADQLVLVLTLI
jgi:hypothetical protein